MSEVIQQEIPGEESRASHHPRGGDFRKGCTVASGGPETRSVISHWVWPPRATEFLTWSDFVLLPCPL